MRLADIHARALMALLSASMLLLAACNGPQQRLDDAMRAYDAKDWNKAFDDASAAQAEAQPPLKQRAAFLAGLAAHRQDRFDEARSRFIAAESSDDPKTAGDAKVMLGDLLTKEGKYAAAAAKYDQAAELLTDDGAARARSLAAAAREMSATPPPAKVAAATSENADDDGAPAAAPAAKSKPAAKPKPSADAKPATKSSRPAATTSRSSGGFTIQCGAYVKESDARARAKDIADEARKAGLPAPQVKRVTGRTGKKLWIVSVGSFKTRAEGKKALAKLKLDHAEVLPVED